MVPMNPNPSVSDTEDYVSDESSYMSEDDIFNVSDQKPVGSAEEPQISQGPTMAIGSEEWKLELMIHKTDDQYRLNDLLPQCEALKDFVTADSRRPEETEELLQTGDPGDSNTAIEQRLDTQASIITNQGFVLFLMPISQQLQAGSQPPDDVGIC